MGSAKLPAVPPGDETTRTLCPPEMDDNVLTIPSLEQSLAPTLSLRSAISNLYLPFHGSFVAPLCIKSFYPIDRFCAAGRYMFDITGPGLDRPDPAVHYEPKKIGTPVLEVAKLHCFVLQRKRFMNQCRVLTWRG